LHIDKLFQQYKDARPNIVERDNLIEELEEVNQFDVPALLAYLKEDDNEIRTFAAYGLGLTRDERAFEPLLALLEDANQDVRYFAIKAIGFIGKNDESAVSPLLKALEDEDSYMRIVAAQALEAFDNERVIQTLRKVSVNDVPQVEEAAKSSLGYIMLKRHSRNQSS